MAATNRQPYSGLSDKLRISGTQGYDPAYLRAIVDMGSNGIRFSISNLYPPSERLVPTIYQSRSKISLYDAQYSESGERQPIAEKTITAVITAFKQFKQTCQDFGVLEKYTHVLATEATRTAINSEDFRRRIKDFVGWEVNMLAKEDEGRLGVWGVASSVPFGAAGLVMDLGGGSTQLSWLTSDKDDGVKMPHSGSVSMPYGAAAMSRRLQQAEREGTTEKLKTEIQSAVKAAFESLEVPANIKRAHGYTLYLSGGGFRGWGYVLMSKHKVTQYPIPIINGFKANRADFMDTEEVKATAASALENEDDEIFRVSDRRASQVPAVAFLINALAEAIPEIEEVRFCQGGVREGFLFRNQCEGKASSYSVPDPLNTATQIYERGTQLRISMLLQGALPASEGGEDAIGFRDGLDYVVLHSFAHMLYYHSTHPKDLQASAALRCTTSGILASAHGLLHEYRVLLALLLCARWGGEVPPTDQQFKDKLEQLVYSPVRLWWINYLGAIAALITAVYPNGIAHKQASRLRLEAELDKTRKEEHVLGVRIGFTESSGLEAYEAELKKIEKVGKKKNWIGGKSGIGYKVSVETFTFAPKTEGDLGVE